MDIRQIFLILSSLLAFAAPFFYTYSVLKGRARPHRTTRLVLLVITTLAFASLLAQNDTVAVWLAGIGTFQTSIVFLLSLKYGMGGWSKLDLICLGIAALGIVIWRVTDNPALALYAAIAADFTGVVPTLVKTWKHPHTEALSYFVMGIISDILNLLAVRTLSPQTVAYPLYLTLINSAIILLILRPRLTPAALTEHS